MTDKLFIYAENADDRDRVKYLEVSNKIFECGHYFRGLHLVGACFSTSFNGQDVTLDNMDEFFESVSTVLTKEEFSQLIDMDNAIDKLGFSIKEGDERYLKGCALYESIQPIIEKLRSPENEALFNKIIEEEKEFMLDEYNLSDEELEEIFANYGNNYQDRGIISYIYADYEELGENSESNDCVFREHEEYRDHFNFASFGEYIAGGDGYYTLSTGRIVSYNN